MPCSVTTSAVRRSQSGTSARASQRGMLKARARCVVVGLGRRGRRSCARDPPRRRAKRSRRGLPAFRLDEAFDAIAGLARLEVEALGADAIVEGRQRHARAVSRLHEHERRRQAAVALRAEEIAAGERVAEQHLVVARIEERCAAGGQASARHAANERSPRALIGPVHLRVDVAVDGIAACVSRARQRPGRPAAALRPRANSVQVISSALPIDVADSAPAIRL